MCLYNFRSFPINLSISFVLLTYLTVSSISAEKPNILFISVDDLRPELGCYGVNYAQSPNIDQFAKTAVTFRNHYVQVSTCGASRYALLTGRSPTKSGALKNNVFYSGKTAIKNKQLPGAQTMPELFRRSGYRTVLIGKISHTPDGKVFSYNGKGDGKLEMPRAWNHLATPMGKWKRGWPLFFAYAEGKHREDGRKQMELMEFIADHDDELPDGLLAESAISQLNQLKEQGENFLMGLGFFKPHLPFVAPKQDWEAFEKTTIPAPLNNRSFDSPYKHDSGEFFKYSTPYEIRKPLDPESAIMAKRAYLACVRYIDRQIGKVLLHLEKIDLVKNTIVVIWGDHGWHLGDAQQWGKHTPFEIANRSVLMIRAPGVDGGFSTNALAETLDIYPTLIDLCKPKFSKTQHPLDGISLVPLLRKEKKLVRKYATSYWKDAISIRSQSHRLIAKVRNKKIIDKRLYNLTRKLDSIKDVLTENSEVGKELTRQVLER
ncbi:MAG: iduronate sulfatase [Verrucomicrobiaceae bacterium TMED76]|nr:MAG: iduronate sulfatase [Verrucomicrobiaceae bacterium TMED76]